MPFGLGATIKRTADFSPCRTWRYTLIREWDVKKPRLLFILLNPSTADEKKDDPTNRRGIDFAIQWGFGAVVFVNLFAIRSPDPLVIPKVKDPVGPDNDLYIAREAYRTNLIVCAWGTHGRFNNRDQVVTGHLAIHYELTCLGRNNDGTPQHPLYMLRTTAPVNYEPPY